MGGGVGAGVEVCHSWGSESVCLSLCLSVSQKITHGGEFEVSFQDKSGGVKNSLTITRFN